MNYNSAADIKTLKGQGQKVKFTCLIYLLLFGIPIDKS